MKVIAHIHNDFTEKFGIPRQSGLVPLVSRIVFEKEYRVKEALRGLDGFSHLWLIWEFSEAKRESWSPTVRPPRLGGNTRMGVFATRSPFRPNPIGLSSVRLVRIDYECENAPVLYVEGADIMDGTPILDIKPYLAYTDSHSEASGGFALTSREAVMGVVTEEKAKKAIPSEKLKDIISILEQDPRPQYQEEGREYTMAFGGYDVTFTAEKDTIKITDIKEIMGNGKQKI